MGVFWLFLKFRLCSKFQDGASGGILYKNLLAGLGVHGPPTGFPVIAPKDKPLSEHFWKEEQQPARAER